MGSSEHYAKDRIKMWFSQSILCKLANKQTVLSVSVFFPLLLSDLTLGYPSSQMRGTLLSVLHSSGISTREHDQYKTDSVALIP
jgi:hypothetical protein